MNRKEKAMDANDAVAWTSYAFSEVCAVYPITPSSVMAQKVDEWSAQGRLNIFGQKVKVFQMQSEAGAAAGVHGALAAGALATTYTASQGLLLMIPSMYKMAGELLPSVIHVSARTISSHALSIFGDHSDVMACRQTGYAMICSNSPQEAMDLSAAAHLCAIEGTIPFLHFFDGFRTSHELCKVKAWDYETLKEMTNMQAVEKFRNNSINPNRNILRGSAQNPDVFFQNREAANPYYNNIVGIVEKYFDKINEKTGVNYRLVNYYGADDAENVIVAMGSVCETAEQTIDYLLKRGKKVGIAKVRLYRPFPKDAFLAAIPESCKRIAVLDRTKEPGALGEPLYMDVCAAFESKKNAPEIFGGRYGIASKDTVPSDIAAVFENLEKDNPLHGFTLSINDDVTRLSLPRKTDIEVTDATECKFWGLGSDGSVGACKSTAKIISDNTDLYVQAYFSYDSKKSGAVTVSDLRFSKNAIKSRYLIYKADFAACHNPSYVGKYDIVSQIKPNGVFLINCGFNISQLTEKLSAKEKRHIAKNNIKVYTIDAAHIVNLLGLKNKTSVIMQTAFFYLTNVIDFTKAKEYLKRAVSESFATKGEEVVNMNIAAIDKTQEYICSLEIPDNWHLAEDEEKPKNLTEFEKDILIPCNSRKGDEIAVSKFVRYADGHMISGTSAYEKRAVSQYVPVWDKDKCIMCNKCSFVCPHAVIRPVLMNKIEYENAPENMCVRCVKEDEYFGIVVSVKDCMGCENCVNICPAPNGGALKMDKLSIHLEQQNCFDYAKNLKEKTYLKKLPLNVKNSQFFTPLLEFSGACAGCGETAYAKLVTQVCGDRCYISNATGCSSIWGASFPSAAYCTNQNQRGPAWTSSLFEDNAEHGLGIAIAAKHMRERIKDIILNTADRQISAAAEEWLKTYDDIFTNTQAADKLICFLKENNSETANEILKMKDYLAKKAVWMFGGDGWAYDIGFGGLDHVIASGEDVNILVFDTEVYSNTGGQASKATPMGAVAQFAAQGKSVGKKNLALMAMTYGYVYVAQVSMGYSDIQTLSAIKEAVSYPGPAIVICYAPCINHGIKTGMESTQEVMKNAVTSGYWQTFRFNPSLEKPFTLDCKPPKDEYLEFAQNELRYSLLLKKYPSYGHELLKKAQTDSEKRYDTLKKIEEFFN